MKGRIIHLNSIKIFILILLKIKFHYQKLNHLENPKGNHSEIWQKQYILNQTLMINNHITITKLIKVIS